MTDKKPKVEHITCPLCRGIEAKEIIENPFMPNSITMSKELFDELREYEREQGKLAVLEMLDDSALLEGLSNIEHEQWMKWSKTISLQESIGQERIGRWKKLWIPYLELTEQDKDHDRKWAKLVLMVIIERLKSQLKEEAKK